MKFLSRLEKKFVCWLLIALCLLFFFLRFPSFIEPYWYGDEGVYEVIGQSLDHGRILYKDIWDNKPPLLYVVYALAQGDQPTVKIISFVAGFLTVIAFFLLSQKLFKKQKVSILTTFLFVLLFGTPILEANIANAENFILLPIILAAILIYSFNSKLNLQTTRYKLLAPKKLFLAGILLGIAFLFKIVAIFDFAAFLLFFIILHLPEKISLSAMKKTITSPQVIAYGRALLLSFLIPLFITVLYFFFNFALKDFFESAFLGNVDYVGWKNSLFGIPQGLLIIKTILLVIGVAVISKYRKHFSPSVLFILLWTLFSLYNAYFSGRPYTHYAIVFLPSFCLFVGLLFIKQKIKIRLLTLAAVILLVVALNNQFSFNSGRVYAYYQNVLAFINNQKSIVDYQSFFDQKVPRDYTIATFINTHTSEQDSVFIWGNNPQIYAMTHKLPLGKYTVAYHISDDSSFNATQQALSKGKPKYIIVLSETQPLPFVIPLYIMRYNITGATIYERSL